MKGKTGEEENVDTEKLQWWSWNNIGWLEDVRKKAISGADNNGQCNISPFLRELNLWKYVLKNYLKIKIDLKLNFTFIAYFNFYLIWKSI